MFQLTDCDHYSEKKVGIEFNKCRKIDKILNFWN